MKKMKKLLILILVLCFGITIGYSQVGKTQAMFIYNFSKLIKWPSNYSQGDFIIGVIGESDTYQALKEFTKDKKVGSQGMSVKKFNNINEISDCHILFISSDKSSAINEIIAKIKTQNSLVISEKKGLINSGSAIDFLVIDNKLRYQMNVSNAEKYNLAVSKSLVDLAYVN
jgi:hypothetical protein